MPHVVRDEDEATSHSLEDQPIISTTTPSTPKFTLEFESRDVLHVVEPDDEETSTSIRSESNHNAPLRRSNRRRIQPLPFWENARQIYGPHNEVGFIGEEMGNMPVVIGVERRSGITYYQPIDADEYYSYGEGRSVAEHSQVSEDNYSIEDEDAVIAADEVRDSDTSTEEVCTLARLIREEYGPPPDRSADLDSDTALQSTTNDETTSSKKTVAQRRNSQLFVQRPRSSLSSRARRQSGCSLQNLDENDSSCYNNDENDLNILTERLEQVNLASSCQDTDQSCNKQLEIENKYLSDCLQCPICHEVKVDDMYLMKCNHRVCGDCALRLDHCHSCRAPRVSKGWLKKIYY